MRKTVFASVLAAGLTVSALGMQWQGAIASAGGRDITGSWLANIDINGNGYSSDDPVDAQALLHFSSDGGLTIVDTTDEGGHLISAGIDSVGYGSWQVEGDAVKLRYVVFNYDLGGSLSGYTRITDVVELNEPGFDSGDGSFSIEVFGLDEDPLGPSKAPVVTGHFDLLRITVE